MASFPQHGPLQMEKDDKGSTMIRMGVSGWKFLLVPAYPGCPGSKAVKRSLLLFSTTTWLSWYPKGKTSLDLNEARDDWVLWWQWHQLDRMQQFAPCSRQTTTSTPHCSIFTGRMLFLMLNYQCQRTVRHLCPNPRTSPNFLCMLVCYPCP